MENLRLLINSWQPTVASIITAFFSFVLFSPDLFADYPWLIELSRFGAAGGLVALGISAKQYNKSGGTND